MESLHRQVLPFVLRRLKEDVLDDLPPKIIQDYYCELSPLQVGTFIYHLVYKQKLTAGNFILWTNKCCLDIFKTIQYRSDYVMT